MIFTDQMNREIRLEQTPQRIISLVPSQTELLYDLELNERVVGITKFCIHPKKWFETKPRVGGTKKVDFEKIASLKPDLIIGNKEENAEEDIKKLMKNYPVWMSDITNFEEAIEMIRLLGEITQTQQKSTDLIKKISNNFEQLSIKSQGKKVLYFIWHQPYMVAGKKTFIDELMTKIGLQNLIKNERYPVFEADKVQTLNPDYVFLSSEPYPFKEKHIKHYKNLFPNAKIVLVDGEFFSWYGSRLEKAPTYFKKLLKAL